MGTSTSAIWKCEGKTLQMKVKVQKQVVTSVTKQYHFCNQIQHWSYQVFIFFTFIIAKNSDLKQFYS